LGQLLLLLGHYMNDNFILCGFSIADDALEDLQRTKSGMDEDRFSSVGILQGASYLSNGLIIGSCQYGYVSIDDPAGWGEAIGMMIMYFVLGQIAMAIFLQIDFFVMFNARNLDKSVTQLIQEDNHPVAIRVAADIIALGICISAPLGQSDSIVTFLVYCGMALALLLLVHFIIRSSFVPTHEMINGEKREVSCKDVVLRGKFFHDDWGCAIVEGVCAIGMAQLLATFLRPCLCYAKFYTL